jgi:hypothetical protein
MMSMGHRYSLVMISAAKWGLQGDMEAPMRLGILNSIDKMVDSTLTPAVIALVEPIDKDGLELCLEALKLGYGPGSPNAFDVLHQKFEIFAALNPSLQRAYDEACRPWSKST